MQQSPNMAEYDKAFIGHIDFTQQWFENMHIPS